MLISTDLLTEGWAEEDLPLFFWHVSAVHHSFQPGALKHPPRIKKLPSLTSGKASVDTVMLTQKTS